MSLKFNTVKKAPIVTEESESRLITWKQIALLDNYTEFKLNLMAGSFEYF